MKINFSPISQLKSKISAKKTSVQSKIAPEAVEKKLLSTNQSSVQDILAPSVIEVDFDYLKINNRFVRTMFVAGYPRYVSANWLSPLINFEQSLDTSLF